jgi:hypothetical protein
MFFGQESSPSLENIQLDTYFTMWYNALPAQVVGAYNTEDYTMTVKSAYDPIDIHTAAPGLWPQTIPPLTAPEAERAVRRLWRFAMGQTLEMPIKFTSGNRYTWVHNYEVRVNPGRGWRHLIHDLSHLFVSRANYNEKPHSKFHARFEAKLVKEVIKRGWLEGKLRDAPKPPPPPVQLDDKRREKLDRLQQRALAWERKQKRAERALAKIRKQARYYERVLNAA